MIRKIGLSNFYSFKKYEEISFITNKKDSYDYYTSTSGDQITKVAAFIGSNSSGKTNIMRFFSFLGYFLTSSSKKENLDIQFIPYKTFFNNTRKSRFYIEFEIDNYIYFYNLVIKNHNVETEKLALKEIKKSAKTADVFIREKGSVTYINKKFFKNLSISSFPEIRADISFIPHVISIYPKVQIIKNVYTFFKYINSNINERGDSSLKIDQIDTIRLYLENSDLREKMVELMRGFGLGISQIEINKKEYTDETDNRKKVQYNIKAIHDTKEKNNTLDFIYESRGTQNLFFVLAKLLLALDTNSTVVLDELELGFHPEVEKKLITYFLDENQNGTAQLFFTSHSFGFLSKLDMHQIYLLEKDACGESFVKRLNQIKGIRSDDNFLKKYLTGSYGAFPNIKI